MKPKQRWLKKDSHISHSPTGGAGTMNGSGAHKMVMHSSESGTGGHSIEGVVEWVKRQGSSYHLIIDDTTKKAVQIYPFDKSARAMLHGYDPGGCNMDGSVVIQVCILGHAADHPAHHLSKWATDLLIDICDSWGIPRHLTMDTRRSRKSWRHSGITTHSSAPGNDHNDLPLPPHFLHPHKEPRNKSVIIRKKNRSLHQVYHLRDSNRFTLDRTRAAGHKFTADDVKRIKVLGVKKGWEVERVTKFAYPFLSKRKSAHWPVGADGHALLHAANLSAREAKHMIKVFSGRRTPREAYDLRMGYLRGKPGFNLAARCCTKYTGIHSWAQCGKNPTSDHAKGGGRAIDAGWISNRTGEEINLGDWKKGAAILRRHGLKDTVVGESWHWSLVRGHHGLGN